MHGPMRSVAATAGAESAFSTSQAFNWERPSPPRNFSSKSEPNADTSIERPSGKSTPGFSRSGEPNRNNFIRVIALNQPRFYAKAGMRFMDRSRAPAIHRSTKLANKGANSKKWSSHLKNSPDCQSSARGPPKLKARSAHAERASKFAGQRGRSRCVAPDWCLWHIARHRPHVDLAGAVDPRFWIRSHLMPLRDPTWHAPNRKHHREHILRNLQGVHDET